MSRIAKLPIKVPKEVLILIDKQFIIIKSKKGKLSQIIHEAVKINLIDENLLISPRKGFIDGWAQAGTTRAIINNMIIGVTKGFIKKMLLVGVGYRALINDNVLSLYLGFSHLIKYPLPSEINVECPSPNEIILKSFDKQLLGQIAANIYSYRRPEPYKGKGIRYANQIIRIKEAKKK
ncbi:MAG: 50S ribosomal protein L6 [Candidatus Dasytiphilus stammeri]